MAQISLTDNPATGPMLDLTKPDKEVEVEIRQDGSVLWVNVDGVCRLRVCRASSIKVIDNRKKGK